MAKVQVTQKEIVINPNFVSKQDTKFFSNDLSKLIRNQGSESNANKLGELTPDIAVQIQNGPKLKDNISFDPFKISPGIWRSRFSRRDID